ncbi:MAG: ATP-binding cassette domain-containing protein [Pelomonas sp.]|nr:ATP-binding cassette domain-containing protein [Roseateles sp.]
MTAAVSGGAALRRRWRVAEVVQTSSMDCGPAALACVLDGFGQPASYGRLREACQTSVDGTSIDTLEQVAQQLGLAAEQVLVPVDHVALAGVSDAPAIAVVQHADLGAHFVVIWRRLGPWVQVMDPSVGRRWMRVAALRRKLYRHEVEVDAADWAAWAAGAENRQALAARLQALGLQPAATQGALAAAAAADGWLGWAALDASTRFAQSVVQAGALSPGAAVQRLVVASLQRCLGPQAQPEQVVPAVHWAVRPAGVGEGDAPRLRLRGAVLLRITGREAPAVTLPPELAAVLQAPAEPAWRQLWRLLREDSTTARWMPWMLCIAAAFTTLAVGLELLLLRGLFDLAPQLGGTGQRLAAAAALLAFLLLRPVWDASTQCEVLRLGRQLDLRLRAALLQRLPRLHDRYFQSRPVSDMADRAHGMQGVRALTPTLLGLGQGLLEVLLTTAGLVWLSPAAGGWAVALAVVSLAIALAALPLLGESDLRVRTHAAALAGFYLDALLGLVPVRAHRAERAMRREHEALLVEWSRSLQVWIRGVLGVEAWQGALALGLATLFIARHFQLQGGVTGGDLLLVFWTLKLPALGRRLVQLGEQLVAQRNALSRLMEPLTAPGAAAGASDAPVVGEGRAWAVEARGVQVLAGGHEILHGLDVRIEAGEHVAVVGVSGAGKSTLVGLLLGWHRPAAGELHVGGRQVSGGQARELDGMRRHMAWVDPAVQLWNRSLLDNLRYATPGEALDRIGDVTRLARLRELAARLPQGLQTVLGEGGGLLSGGEGQRVRLARALMQADPRLVLLDEPFRGLDRPQRQALLGEARQWWQGSTLLCVTHDIAHTLDFPRVLVIEGGQLLEDGPPQVLAAQASRYRQLLDAESALQSGAWGGDAWRRLVLHDGRLAEVESGR